MGEQSEWNKSRPIVVYQQPCRECPLKAKLVDQILGLIPWEKKANPPTVAKVRGLNWSSGRSPYKRAIAS